MVDASERVLDPFILSGLRHCFAGVGFGILPCAGVVVDVCVIERLIHEMLLIGSERIEGVMVDS